MQNIWALQTPAQTAKHTFRSKVTPAAGAMGAYVEGIDIRSATTEDIAEVEALLAEFKAVMLRGQSPELTVEQYSNFGAAFGVAAIDPYVEPHFPETPHIMGLIRESGDTEYNFGGDWHSDGSYLEKPGGITILWGKDVPPYGCLLYTSDAADE